MNENSIAIISWALLLVAVAAITFVAWYIPVDRSRYIVLLRAFYVELPAVTKMVFSLPAAVFQMTAGALVLLAVGAQVLARSKASAALFHMLLIVFCCLAFSIYREAIQRAMIVLLQGIRVIAGA